MPALESLQNFMSKYVSLSEDEFAQAAGFFELRHIEKKHILVHEGNIEKYLNFIESGLARLFFIRQKTEVVLQFSMESQIICSYESFLTGQPSHFTVEALEPLVVYSITLKNLEKMFDLSPKMERLGRLFATDEYIKKANVEYQRMRETTTERFLDFFRTNSNLVQRVQQKHLASYLNIQPETFSRMKHLTRGRL